MVDSGCILKVELMGLADKLGEGMREREQSNVFWPRPLEVWNNHILRWSTLGGAEFWGIDKKFIYRHV